MADPITRQDVLTLAGLVDNLAADALIEDALAPRTSPHDEEIQRQLQAAEDSGDSVRGKAARILHDLYVTRRLWGEA
ncbi:hypothetical protein AB0C77_23440 [Streptomyces sp. NPDC048629]|uniref:hypothetical protein n=1 Tax=Streptomyces sp. NPDC048629 TaxID=3154824 RepID=UPI0034282F5B